MIDEKAQSRRNRTVAVLLILSVGVSLLFLMYAFAKKAEADSWRETAERNHAMANQQIDDCTKSRRTLLDSIAVLNAEINREK
jgi:hypothetical protein